VAECLDLAAKLLRFCLGGSLTLCVSLSGLAGGGLTLCFSGPTSPPL